MKPYNFLLLSFFIIKTSFAQPSVPEPKILNIEKKVSRFNRPHSVTLQFKPEKVLNIRTSEGHRVTLKHFLLQENAIVWLTGTDFGMQIIDTIPLQDIVKIRGKVYGNAARKAGGTILALGGVPMAAMGIIVATLSSSSAGAVVMMLPGIGLSVWGISLTGARSFKTTDKWKLKTTPCASIQVNCIKSQQPEFVKRD